jgi:hypothetical protein
VKRVRGLVHTHTHQSVYNMHARHDMDGEHTMHNTYNQIPHKDMNPTLITH